MHKNSTPKRVWFGSFDFFNLGTNINNMMNNWLDGWWSFECCQQILTVEYVDNIKRRIPFIAANGHAETQRINESSHEWCGVDNELVWSKYVDNSKRRLISIDGYAEENRTEFICTHW